MIAIGLQALFGFALTAALLLLLRRPALEAGLVDRPCPRKRHGRTVPLIGGICILLGFVSATLPLEFGLRDYQALYAGMTTLLVVGVVDDLIDIDARAKLAFQVVAALLMTAWGGVVIEDLGSLLGLGVALPLGNWAQPLTVFCVVGLVNAVNMFDGVDGLAAGTVAAALAWLVIAGALGGAGEWPVLAGLLLAAVSGFLLFNMRNPWRRRATAFLGDSGSMMLGFALAWFAVQAAQGPDAALPAVAVAWVLALPVFDAVALIGRRLLHGYSPFRADREHLHHIFYRAGFTAGQTVCLLTGASTVYGGIGVLGAYWGLPAWLSLLLLAALLAGHLALHARAWRSATLLRRLLRWGRRGATRGRTSSTLR